MELLMAGVVLLLLMPTLYATVSGAPIALTNKIQINKILDSTGLKSEEKFYDLGTGTGRVMVAAAKRNVNVVGFELSPVFYLITLVNLKIHGVKRYELHYRNFFRANLKNADIVYCFLTPRTMERLKPKLVKELKPGSRVVSHIFEISGWHPYTTIKRNTKPGTYLYKIERPGEKQD